MIAALVQRIVDFIQPLYTVAGYAVIGLGVLGERSILIGLVMPGDIILALGGVYAAKGDLSLPLVILVGTIAAACGESIGYWLGRRHGLSLVRRLPMGGRVEERMGQAEAYFARHGGKTVSIGRFATAAGAFIPFVAGLSHMPYRRFLMFDLAAIVVWAAGISIFGFIFGRRLDFIDTPLSRFGLIMLAALAAFIVGRIVWNSAKRRRDRPGPEDPNEAES